MAASPDGYDPRAESEQEVLGAIMRDTAVAWPQVKDLLIEAHFGSTRHRLIFGAIAAVIENTGVADPVAVMNELHARGQLELAGGREYVQGLREDCMSAIPAGAHAKEVRKAAGADKVIDITAEIQARRPGAADAARILSDAADRLRRDFGDDAEKPRPERRPMRWAELEGSFPEPREWTISHWLTSGPTLMAGQGGVGKSLLAQTIGTALVLGRSFIDDIEVKPRTVLIWACEDEHDEIWRRQLDICKFFGARLSDVEGKLIIEPRIGKENTLYSIAFGAPIWTPLKDELAEQIRDYHADVFFLDNIAHTYGAKENERHPVTQFVNGIAGIADGLAAVIMGHPAKTADSEFSGSTAWENAVRMRWYMGYKLPDQEPEEGASEDTNVRYLAKRKANYSAKDFRKLDYRDGLFVPETKGPGDGFAARWSSADRAKGATECILFALAAIVKAGIRVTDGRTSPEYLPKKMREMKLAADYTPRELGSALSQLRLAGQVIEIKVGQYANRMPKMGLGVA